MDEDIPPTAPPASKPSQIPSWVSIGFVLGALFVLALPRRQPEAPPAAAQPEPGSPGAFHPPPPQPLLTTIEAVFADWGGHAVWDNDRTEVALWNSETKAYTDCYEVVRTGGTYYFRSIPRLTRPVLTHGVLEDSPLQFTESERQRQQWLEDVRKQNWKDLSESARQQFGPPEPPDSGEYRSETVAPPGIKPMAPPAIPTQSNEKDRNR